MSRHGTDRNPAQTLRKALDAFERLAGVMPRVVCLPRNCALARATRALLRSKAVLIRVREGWPSRETRSLKATAAAIASVTRRRPPALARHQSQAAFAAQRLPAHKVEPEHRHPPSEN